MEDKIFNVLVPTEKKIKIKGNKRVEEEEKIYPGYVLVDMVDLVFSKILNLFI
jgi:transcriptional antiterminator NusG